MLPSNHSKEENEQDEIAEVSKKKKESHEKLRQDNRDDKLLNDIIQTMKSKIDNDKILNDAINKNISSFTPDFAFEQMVKDYKTSRKLYGDTMIRELTGYDPNYIGRNISVPEFKRELKSKIQQNIERLKEDGLIDKDGFITDEGYEFSALASLDEDFDIITKISGFGTKTTKKSGEQSFSNFRDFKKGDSFKHLSVKRSVKKALRRSKENISNHDLVSKDLKADSKINIIYCLDISGSMRGEKIKLAKRAGMILAYKAITNNDKIGVILFNNEVRGSLEPGSNFEIFLKKINNVRTQGETDITSCLDKAYEMFKGQNNHLVLLTDGMQTRGKNPVNKVLASLGPLIERKVSVSFIGVNLADDGIAIAESIVNVSKGKLYQVKGLEGINDIIIEDYYSRKGL